MDIIELKECVGNSSIYFYMSLDGINIIPEDPIVGDRTCLLNEETDNRPKREHPYVGERLDYCTITNQLTGAFELVPSNWVVFHVEVFPGNQLVREVVVAWCKKED